MIAKTYTGSLSGLTSHLITVEVDLQANLPAFSTVGLPDGMIKESKERIKAALENSGFSFPSKKIVVNLAPADLKKEGTAFDLPISVSLLAAADNISQKELHETLFLGELSLTGDIKPIRGILAHLMMAREKKFKKIIIPYDNLKEASIFSGITILGARTLSETATYLAGECQLTSPEEKTLIWDSDKNVDMSFIQGQSMAKRALEVTVAGGHNLLFMGPPGSGKTLLAKAIPSILPPLSFDEALEVAKIQSVVQEKIDLNLNPPFESPHHTISHIALVGGGTHPSPGLVTRAHRGVLFLDEVGEFEKRSLEVLRQVIEEKKVTITRAKGQETFPANFHLVLASNPCPCGYLTHQKKSCICTAGHIMRYRSKLSGPILDRIDLHLEVQPIENFLSHKKEEPSSAIRQRIIKCRKRQKNRFLNLPKIELNSQISPLHIFDFCSLDSECKKILEKTIEKMHLSHRSFHNILKVSRTIADLEEHVNITKNHIFEALQYRNNLEIKSVFSCT